MGNIVLFMSGWRTLSGYFSSLRHCMLSHLQGVSLDYSSFGTLFLMVRFLGRYYFPRDSSKICHGVRHSCHVSIDAYIKDVLYQWDHDKLKIRRVLNDIV